MADTYTVDSDQSCHITKASDYEREIIRLLSISGKPLTSQQIQQNVGGTAFTIGRTLQRLNEIGIVHLSA